MKKNKTFLKLLMIVGLLLIVVGITYAFFNYTRVGVANSIKTGRLVFSTTQEGRINLTNVFPMSSENIDNVLETGNNVTINITGGTDYENGIEYLVTAEDVKATVNNKKVPVSLYMAGTSDLGTEDENYFDNRGGNTSIYKVLSGGVITEGQYLLVGYIAPGQNDIDGSLNIKAFIDEDLIAITDTYDGTESDEMGTPTEWVRGREVFTASEWSSLKENNALSFKIRVEANEGTWVDPYTTPNLMNSININRNAVNIKEIRFIQETPLRMQRRYDASVGQESNGTKGELTYNETGKVLAWIEPISNNPTGTNNELLNVKPSFLASSNISKNSVTQIDNEESYILYIASSGETKWVYTGFSNLFAGFNNVEKIIFENFDTSAVPIMNDMFKDLSKLSSVNVNALDTSSVVQMTGFFSGCSSLVSVDLSGLGSDILIGISNMFYNCNSLKNIIMKNFNFGHVNFNQTVNNYSNYYYAFAYLPNVETIDLTNANTSGVTNMFDMFYNCTKLSSIIGLNTLDTSSVTDMGYMFSQCSALTSIDLSNLNTSSVQNMQNMFSGCDNLESVIIHGNGNGVLQNIGSMFYNCPKLLSIDLAGLGGDNLNSYSDIFYNCTSLKNINMSNFNFGKINSFSYSSSIFKSLQGVLETINLSRANFSGPNITTSSFQAMFEYFTKLKSIDFSNANTSKVTNMMDMFGGCILLESVNLSGIDTSNVTNMGYMFSDCDSITSLDLRHLNTSKVTNMHYMFRLMDNLEEIDLSGWGNNNLSDTYGMFDSDNKLKTIIMNNFNFGTSTNGLFRYVGNVKEIYLNNAITNNVTDMQGMFANCPNLKTIYVSNTWNTSNVTNSYNVFFNCTSLVGGNGTRYDNTKIGINMAVIDTPSTPGYLTLITN